MDRTDAAWAALDFTYAWFGLDVPPVEEMRRALAIVIEADPLIGSELDLASGRYRVLDGEESSRRPEQLISGGLPSDLSSDNVLDRFEFSLGSAPFMLFVDRETIVIRWSHAVGDAWSCLTLVKHLIDQARTDERLPLPWDSVAPRRRDLLTVRSVVRRPATLWRAIRDRAELSGGPYELASLRTADETFSTVACSSRSGFLESLLAERSRRGVRASTAAILLTGFRLHLTRRAAPPLPGVEMLFDVRGGAEETKRAFGNWAVGVYVNPPDDESVEAVSAEIKRVRDEGFPFIAAAAARRRAGLQRAGDRKVMAPLGRPRLTLTHLNRGGPQIGFPWLPDREHEVLSCCEPNGLETILIGGRELEGRLNLSISHYPAAWSTALIEQVVQDFWDDPWGDSVRARSSFDEEVGA